MDTWQDAAGYVKSATQELQRSLSGASAVESIIVLTLIQRAAELARDIRALNVASEEDRSAS